MEPTAEDKAKAVIDTAANAAKVLIESATIPPWMEEHIADEAEKHQKMEEVIATLATKHDLKGLATEASVREIIHLYQNIEMARVILSGGGKWSYRALLIVAGLVGAVVTITGGWKYLIGLFFASKS